ncbi:MAG: TrmB family transcriptional regulator [Candidatus Nanoarchaeia archaeon]
MLVDNLQKIGFSVSESKIYLCLISNGPLMAGDITKKTLINRRTVYDTLERLLEKGYVSYNLETNRKVFIASNPSTIISNINNIQKEAAQIQTELNSLYIMNKSQTKVETYRGRKGIRSILNYMLKAKTYVGFGSNEKFPEIMKHDFELFQKTKAELKIKSRTLMSSSMKNKPILKSANTEYRFLKEKFSPPTSTFVFENKVAIIIWDEEPIATLIESKTISDTYLHYFNSLWETAEK